jgi:heme exporter protein B
MSSYFYNLLKQDFKIAFTKKVSLLNPLIFFLTIIFIFPFSVGPKPELLNKVIPAFILIGLLFAIILTTSNLFEDDYRDGTLEQLLLFGVSPYTIIINKILYSWLITTVPIILVLPLISLIFSVSNLVYFIIGIMLVSISVSLFNCFVAILTINLQKNFALASLIILPFMVPFIIYAKAYFDILNYDFSRTNLFSSLCVLIGLLLIFLPLIIFFSGMLLKDSITQNR